jgi:hypothetical protein
MIERSVSKKAVEADFVVVCMCRGFVWLFLYVALGDIARDTNELKIHHTDIQTAKYWG